MHTVATAELRAEVRAAAGELVEDLTRAGEVTGRWSDCALTDALVEAALTRCLVRLAATGCWGEANRLPSSELWQIAGPLLEVGSLQHHARFKPRGYAGDYQMLTRICEQSCCEHPLGRAFDRYFLRQGAPEAVRARTEQIAAMLTARAVAHPSGAFRVVSVGSGPAWDVYQALAVLPKARRRWLRVTLLDLDPDALEAAEQRIGPLLAGPEALTCHRLNLFRLAHRPDAGATLGTPDFLICSGLFDYLVDEAAAELLGLFWQRLAPGGLALVGNFAPHNPTRAYMEWIGNWYLTYRTPDQLRQLAACAGIPSERVTITSDRTGIDLFLVGAKA